MAIRTSLLTVLSKGPPIILRGSFLLFLNQYRNWQILSMGRDELLLLELSQQVIPFAMSNPTFVVLLGAFLAHVLWSDQPSMNLQVGWQPDPLESAHPNFTANSPKQEWPILIQQFEGDRTDWLEGGDVLTSWRICKGTITSIDRTW